jgi:Na+-driven multidrug efflux pump
VTEIAIDILRINVIASPLLGLNFVFQNYLRNISDIKPTIWMSSAEVVSRGALPYMLGAKNGYRGIWFATPIGWLLSFLIGLWRYVSRSKLLRKKS